MAKESFDFLAPRITNYVLALLLGVSLPPYAAAQSISLKGVVVAVLDGDTMTLLDLDKNRHKIRLSGIDAPEKKQAFGQRSKQSLSDLVFSREVVVHTQKTDRYGRLLGRIQLGETDVNLEQLRRGMAWHYKRFAGEQPPDERVLYSNTEAQARLAGVGLWRDAQAVPPWIFRHPKRSMVHNGCTVKALGNDQELFSAPANRSFAGSKSSSPANNPSLRPDRRPARWRSPWTAPRR